MEFRVREGSRGGECLRFVMLVGLEVGAQDVKEELLQTLEFKGTKDCPCFLIV